ncbi:hypothetical protein WR25_00702 [Diploscapter pachys]|uniref:SAM-dependent MTase TRM10-type domain-containing protein n=1 Tax=Diploscapter pachys TaxID=2018661 RepID=A0A2A2LV24_9BILA|nr:hypothetical protein WR25_00702 [Diploscapter pachys]
MFRFSPNLMEKLENVISYTRWYVRRLIRPKKTPIQPVVWRAARAVGLPSAKFVGNLDVGERQKLDRIQKEIEKAIFQLFSRLTEYFPENINDKDWKDLLECETTKQRLEQITFLRQREKRKQLDERKKEAKKLQKLEKMEMKAAGTSSNGQKEFIDLIFSTPGLMNETPNIIVDCRFLPKLTNRALNLTANQMTFMHVENREKSQLLTVSSPSNLGPAILPDLHAYRQMYPQKKMIYLSPHVEAELEKIEDDHTYIIGGIVDRVREPHIPPDASRVAAEQDWIECRKLPIDKYVQWQSGNKFLTLTAVYNILYDCWMTQDWEYALRK